MAAFNQALDPPGSAVIWLVDDLNARLVLDPTN
jgi:hypothetical protein